MYRLLQISTACVFLLTGCGPDPTSDLASPNQRNQGKAAVAHLFDGRSGEPLDWGRAVNRAADADVIILGETHTDRVGHAVQLDYLADVLGQWPGGALSMEMLDRSEQAIVDDYLAGLIKREAFLQAIASTNWRKITTDYLANKIDRQTFRKQISRLGWPDWENNYQPIIDAAKEAGAKVVAANTPWLKYASLANRHGFDRLNTLTVAQRALVEVPKQIPAGTYRERFWEVMVGRREGEQPKKANTDGATAHGHGPVSDEQVLGMFRAQLVADATMADSIANALVNGANKVIHLVGQFHSDFEGGVVQELRLRSPGVRILNISLQPVSSVSLREEDRDRADIVIYTQ